MAMKFKDIALRPEIHQALDEMGYETLTPVQEQTFLPIISNRDIVAIAETGSGKTSACAIPLVQLIDEHVREIQVLILVPTRELACQYVEEIDRVAQHTEIDPFAVYGGFSMHIQRQKFKQGVHILVATPGRLIDWLHQGEMSFRHLRTLVLDEADEMLDMGFIDDVEFIMSCITVQHQTLLFSATMPAEIERLIGRYLHDPEHIALNRNAIAPASLRHTFISVPARQREAKLRTFLNDRGAYRQVIVFVNSRINGERLYRELKRAVPQCDYIHGGMSQDLRTIIFNKFKRGTLRVMLATDVAGRGLDFTNVTHVINYDFPRTAEIYTHRTGRTGRMGRTGTAMSLVTERDRRLCERVIRQNAIEAEWIGEPPPAGPSRGRSDRKRGGRRRPPRK